jgi:hypothetical protein
MKQQVIEIKEGKILYLHFPSTTILNSKKFSLHENPKNYLGIIITAPSYDRLNSRHIKIIQFGKKLFNKFKELILNCGDMSIGSINVNNTKYLLFVSLDYTKLSKQSSEIITNNVMDIIEES